MEGARPFLDADFPGYAEAVARESLVRSAACLGLNEKICGLEVKPLTAYHVRLLVLVQSPFLLKIKPELLAGRPDIVDDVMKFLWIISPMFKAGSKTTSKWWLWRSPRDKFNCVFAAVLKQRIDNVCREILEYIDEAYIDAEPPINSDKSYYEFEIGIADELNEHYGYRADFWNPMPIEKNPVHVPLKLIFQFRKRRLQNAGQIVCNQSEKLILAGLDAMNKKEKDGNKC
jgi:hypothetical protein